MTILTDEAVKQLVPRSVKDAIKTVVRHRQMSDVVRRFGRLAPGEVPSSALLASLEHAWGEDGFRARGGYLAAVAQEAAKTRGPVLEAGTGLTTLLLGMLAGQRGADVWSVEHLPVYHQRTQAAIARYRVCNVRVVLASLAEYGEFSWYSSSELARMPRDFRLVVADGPPAGTHGGRYGLLPVMRSHFASDVVILVDDAMRSEEQAALAEWERRFHVSCEMHAHDSRVWAVCRLP